MYASKDNEDNNIMDSGILYQCTGCKRILFNNESLPTCPYCDNDFELVKIMEIRDNKIIGIYARRIYG